MCRNSCDGPSTSGGAVSLSQEVTSKVAGLVLKLKEKHNVSQPPVQSVVENIGNLIQVVHNHSCCALEPADLAAQ